MSYAKLAGLHPIYGLYSGFVPIFVYAIFGSSRQLAIGPVALVSLLVSNVLGGITDTTDALYSELAILLALMVGILECVMGILRLGWLIRFISHSVISGFTSASAVIIALSQAKYFLGYSIVRSSEIIPLIKSIIAGANKFSWPPFVMGSTILAILLIMKHLGKTKKYLRFMRAAGPLTAVVLDTTVVKIFHPPSISLVGDIPQGLPKFSVPKSFDHVRSLIPTAILITGVAILESVGIAKALAAKNGYDLDSNQEILQLRSWFLQSVQATKDITLPLACVILVGLFALQHYGTHRVRFLFAPIVITWLLCISSIGLYNILYWNPHVYRALSPYYMYTFLKKTQREGWMSLGGILLCITGSEAMFADLGHFSQLSIKGGA